MIWTFDRDAWLIRAYLWLWRGDEDKINFCKLFWGALFSPVALIAHAVDLIVRPVVWVFGPPADALGRFVVRWEREKNLEATVRKNEKKRERREREGLEAISLMKRRPNRYQRFLTGVGGVADRCVAVTQSHAVAIRRVGTAILITLVIVVVTLLVWLCVLVPWREVGEAIVDAPWDQVAVVAGTIAGGGLLGGAVVTLIIFVGEDRFLGLGRGIKTTFLFFKDGIFTVKHRTCPNVVIRPVAAGREYCGIEHLPTKAR